MRCITPGYISRWPAQYFKLQTKFLVVETSAAMGGILVSFISYTLFFSTSNICPKIKKDACKVWVLQPKWKKKHVKCCIVLYKGPIEALHLLSQKGTSLVFSINLFAANVTWSAFSFCCKWFPSSWLVFILPFVQLLKSWVHWNNYLHITMLHCISKQETELWRTKFSLHKPL